jgi:hypothetical protein
MGNFLMAANETLKKRSYYSGNKASSERFVECFINKRWRFSCNKRKEITLLDKIIAPDGIFSQRYSNSTADIFKRQDVEILSESMM